MSQFLILKTGGTFAELAEIQGDFEHWTADGMGLAPDQWQCVNAQAGEALPEPDGLLGCVITGSHAMVTDGDPWIEKTKHWVRRTVTRGLPMLGICFGHQLMADALGGRADYHPDGLEIGTVSIRLTGEENNDPIFRGMPNIFSAHVTHSQSAQALPPSSVLLGGNRHEPHQAFRVGQHAWGVQFHPEFNVAATRYYVDQLKEKILQQGGDPAAISDNVKSTPESAHVLPRFAKYCLDAALSI